MYQIKLIINQKKHVKLIFYPLESYMTYVSYRILKDKIFNPSILPQDKESTPFGYYNLIEFDHFQVAFPKRQVVVHQDKFLPDPES